MNLALFDITSELTRLLLRSFFGSRRRKTLEKLLIFHTEPEAYQMKIRGKSKDDLN